MKHVTKTPTTHAARVELAIAWAFLLFLVLLICGVLP